MLRTSHPGVLRSACPLNNLVDLTSIGQFQQGYAISSLNVILKGFLVLSEMNVTRSYTILHEIT